MFHQNSSGSPGSIVIIPKGSASRRYGSSARLRAARPRPFRAEQREARVEAFLDELKVLNDSVRATQGETLAAVSQKLESVKGVVANMDVPSGCDVLRDLTVRQYQAGLTVLSASETLLDLADQLTVLADKLATRKRRREAMEARFASLQEEMKRLQMESRRIVEEHGIVLEKSAQVETRKLRRSSRSPQSLST